MMKRITRCDGSEASIISANKSLEILEENAKEVNSLGVKSEAGRNKINTSAEYAETILQRSDSLIEASTIIKNIAEQTNLLAMMNQSEGSTQVLESMKEMTEMTSNAQQIINSTKIVTSGSDSNKENMLSIQKEVGQFRL